MLSHFLRKVSDVDIRESFTGARLERGGLPYLGAYILRHRKTGRFYVGSTSNFKRRRIEHIKEFREGTHHVKELQDLYNEDPHFEFEFIISGQGVNNVDAREKAYDFEQELLDKHWGDPLLVNYSKNARFSELEGERLEIRRGMARNLHLDPEISERRKEGVRKAYEDPLLQDKRVQFLKELRKRPEQRESARQIATGQWQDPAFRAKMQAARQDPDYLARQRNQPHSKRLSIKGQIFDGVQAAAKALGMSRNTIKQRCASDLYPDYRYV